MKSQIHNKKNDGIGESLITLNNIIRNQGSYFVVIINSRLKLMSALGYGRVFSKKLLMRGQKLFWAKKIIGRLF